MTGRINPAEVTVGLLQKQRRRQEPSFLYQPADLKLPARLYELRKKGVRKAILNRAAALILAGRCDKASAILSAP